MLLIKGIFLYLQRILGFLIVTIFTSLVLTITIQIIFRILSISSSWTTEVAIFLFVWLVFIGGFFTIRKGSNITFDLIIDKLKGKMWRVVYTFVNLVSVAFLLFMIFEGFTLAFSVGGNSPVLNVPLKYGYLALPIGGIVMLIAQVERYIVILRNVEEGK